LLDAEWEQAYPKILSIYWSLWKTFFLPDRKETVQLMVCHFPL
jgi:hypothetical protein